MRTKLSKLCPSVHLLPHDGVVPQKGSGGGGDGLKDRACLMRTKLRRKKKNKTKLVTSKSQNYTKSPVKWVRLDGIGALCDCVCAGSVSATISRLARDGEAEEERTDF